MQSVTDYPACSGCSPSVPSARSEMQYVRKKLSNNSTVSLKETFLPAHFLNSLTGLAF